MQIRQKINLPPQISLLSHHKSAYNDCRLLRARDPMHIWGNCIQTERFLNGALITQGKIGMDADFRALVHGCT